MDVKLNYESSPIFKEEEIYKISQADFNKELFDSKNKALKFLNEFYQEYNEKLSCADSRMTPKFDNMESITIKASDLIEALMVYTNKDKDYAEILDRLYGYKSTAGSLLKKLISGFTKLNYKKRGKSIWINIHISQMKLICMILEYQYMALIIDIIHRCQQASNAKSRSGVISENAGLTYKINDFIREEMIGSTDETTSYSYLEYSSLLSKNRISIKKSKVTKEVTEVSDEEPEVTTNKKERKNCIIVTAVIPEKFFGKKLIITVQ